MKSTGKTLLAVAAMITAIATWGCGANSSSTTGHVDSTGTATTDATASSKPAVAAHARGTAAPELKPADPEAILAAVRAPGAQAVLVNVWATWCIPCRDEFPDLVRLERDYRDRGLRVVFVSADFEDQTTAARDFLARHGVDYPTYLKTGDDMKFIDALSPAWTGALPATVIYDGGGKRVWFHEGKADYATFERHVLEVLKPNTKEGSPS